MARAPDTAERRHRSGSGALEDARGNGTDASIDAAAVSGPRCAWCQGRLPGRRRRFCCDDHRRRGQKSERVTEDAEQGAATGRMLAAAGRRARHSLEALAELVCFERSAIPELKRMAVADLRAQGYSDREIGRALGITSQRVGQLYGLKAAFHADLAGTGGAA
jgi:hypothetical protein